MNTKDVKKERTSRGLSQNHLAHLAGVGQATISLVERGLVTLSSTVEEKITKALESYDRDSKKKSSRRTS